MLEVRRSFDYFQLQQRNKDIHQVLISGGGSQLNNLVPYFTRELGLVVQNDHPLEVIAVPDKVKPEFESSTPLFMVALELALREVMPE